MMTHRLSRWVGALLFASHALAIPAAAQYFGGNKVIYKHFDYRVLHTDHFDIYYYPSEEQAVGEAARMAERWYSRLSGLFDHQLGQRQPLVLYASAPDFQQTNVIEGAIGEGTGGVTEALKRRIVMPMASTLAETDHVLGHELVHAFQYDITTSYGRPSGQVPGAVGMPLWFIEGMAEYFSIGPDDPNTAMWIRDAIARDDLPSVRDLERSYRYFPYRYGEALLAYVGGRWGDRAVAQLLKAATRGNIEGALQSVLGVDAKQLTGDWHTALRETYGRLVAELPSAEAYGRRPFTKPGRARDPAARITNLAPALSPDGKRVAFFSSRKTFSVDLFVADVETGEILRQLTRTALDPHFSSLEFIDSAGAWAPDGHRLALTAVSGGKARIVVFDVDRNRVEQEIELAGLDQAFTPTWSPDGKEIAFSAKKGGAVDLFVCELASGDVVQQTHDLSAELMPAWSPDGAKIAFVTDRFDADLANLRMGDYQLALFDMTSSRIEPLPGFPGAKNVNPQWSADGKSLYFVSDRDGISNLYLLSLIDGRIRQITELSTGVSGITPLSPTISVASRAPRVMFVAYSGGTHDIYVADSETVLAGHALRTLAAEAAPSLLPPQRRDSLVAVLLEDPTTGLPPADVSFRTNEYKPRLALDYVAQPFVVAGADPFGTYIGGGTALTFSDMLGNHELTTLFQVQGGVRDIAGLVGYRNLSRRWNWGAVFEQVPYVTGGYASGLANVGGEPAQVDQVIRYRQTNTVAAGVLAYPFDTARRVEFTGGYRRVGFSGKIQTAAYSLIDGALLIDDTQDIPSPNSINLGQAAAALVGDRSYFGATSPILGERYRLGAAPNFGTINFTNVTADYRRYFMPLRPYTLAVRALHFGRYGSGAEDERLSPLFLGYPNLVRGYEYNSFSTSECTPSPSGTSSCIEFDRLLGSRLFVGNVELRVPIYGAFRRGGAFYGPIPVEAAVFADAGVALHSGDNPSFFLGDEKFVKSFGVALRANAFGFFIVELDFVNPLDRLEGWHFTFNFLSGF